MYIHHNIPAMYAYNMYNITQDSISIKTAESALEEILSMLQRMRELAVQATNDTLTLQDRKYIQLEIDKLKERVEFKSKIYMVALIEARINFDAELPFQAMKYLS